MKHLQRDLNPDSRPECEVVLALRFPADAVADDAGAIIQLQFGHNPKEAPMPRYVDGFVIPVSSDRLSEYRRISRRAGKIWKEHGALEYVECVADEKSTDMTPNFPKSVRLKPGEVLVFSWITYKSRAARNRVMKKVLSDPRLADMMDDGAMPFDQKRMMYGGFSTFVEL